MAAASADATEPRFSSRYLFVLLLLLRGRILSVRLLRLSPDVDVFWQYRRCEDRQTRDLLLALDPDFDKKESDVAKHNYHHAQAQAIRKMDEDETSERLQSRTSRSYRWSPHASFDPFRLAAGARKMDDVTQIDTETARWIERDTTIDPQPDLSAMWNAGARPPTARKSSTYKAVFPICRGIRGCLLELKRAVRGHGLQKEAGNEGHDNSGGSPRTSRIRKWCTTVAENEDFQLMTVVLILANCVTLALYDPMEPSASSRNSILEVIDLAFNVVFTIELLVQIGAHGLWGYISHPWYAFDGAMVLIGYTGLLDSGASNGGASSLKALRALRALRPLRTITRFQSLRSVIVCFLEALPLLMSVLGLIFFYLFLFAIVGLQIFSEIYHTACFDDVTRDPEPLIGEFPDEFGCGGSRECPTGFSCRHVEEGTNTDVAGFDNIASSLLTVFQCTTLGGWSFIMYRAMDSTSVFSSFYFVVLILFGAYFLINLFLAVLKTKFGKAQSTLQNRAATSPRGRKTVFHRVTGWLCRQWHKFSNSNRISTNEASCRDPTAKWSSRLPWIRRVVTAPLFSNFFIGCILLNTVVLAMEYDGMSARLEFVLSAANIIFTALFTAELILKLLALGRDEYCSDLFNVFDAVVVLFSIAELTFEVVSHGDESFNGLGALKCFRVFRLMKMFRYLSSLRKIAEVLASSASSFIAIVILMLIFMVVFAIVGLHVYGGVFSNDVRPNFNTFLDANVVMFNVLTLEDWEIVMHAVIRETNDWSVLFFVSWVILGKYVFLTLFLAVILDAFESKYDADATDEATPDIEQKNEIQNHSDSSADAGGTCAQSESCDGELIEAEVESVERLGTSLDSESFNSETPSSDIQLSEQRQDKKRSRREFDELVPRLNLQEALGIDPFEDKTFSRRSYAYRSTTETPTTDRRHRLSRRDFRESFPGRSGWQQVSIRSFGERDRYGVDLASTQRHRHFFQPSPRTIGYSTARPQRCVTPFPGADFSSLSDSDDPSHASQNGTVADFHQSRSLAPNLQTRTAPGICENQPEDKQTSSNVQDSPREAGGPHALPTNRIKSVEAERVSNKDDVAWWMFGPDHPFRVWTVRCVLDSDVFDYGMFLMIILSCVAMTVERPSIEATSSKDRILFILDIYFTAIFGLEFILKSVALTYRVYIQSLTNKVDLAIVLSSVLVLVLESLNVRQAKTLRVLRAIKPFRVLTRSEGMLMVLRSLTLSLAAMANVSIVCILFCVIFAILGVQLFAGKFYRCNDDTVDFKEQCIGTFFDPESGRVERTWANAVFHFDDIGGAMLTLFITVTQDGYYNILYNAMSVTGRDRQPRHMANPLAFFYFMAFIMVCAFCLLNLYVGVVFYQFSRIRLQNQAGSAFFSSKQQEWSELSRMVFRLKPIAKAPMPRNPFRRWCYRLALSHVFDHFITATIIANVILLAATVYGEPEGFVSFKETCNVVFTFIFGFEAALKIFSFSWGIYIKSGWNQFDFALVVISAADFLFSYASIGSASVGHLLAVRNLLRLLRVSRMFKLIRGLKGIRSLFSTLVISLPAFWNVGALVFLLFFVYAYVGVLFFGGAEHGVHINEHTNFDSFPMALLTLFRVATNDEWKGVLEGCMQSASLISVPYFVSFVVNVSMIMLNLFTAVIIENFEKQQDQDQWKLHPSQLEDFVELWSEYDDGSTTVAPKELEKILIRIKPPLGLGPYADSNDVLRFVYELDIPVIDGRVPFYRTAYELARRCSETHMPQGEIKNQLDRLFDRFFEDLPVDDPLNFSTAVLVPRLERRWRARLNAKKVRRRLQTRAERSTLPTAEEMHRTVPRFLQEMEKMTQKGNCLFRLTPETMKELKRIAVRQP